MNITVEEKGLDQIIAGMTDFEKQQVPYAMSRTVNELGYKTQRDTIDRLLPEKFVLRNDWWKPGRKTGVNYFPSHKKQYPNIFAKVNTLAYFMELQETGGIKRPRAGSAFVPIPTFNAQPDKRQVVRASRRFRQLTTQAGTIVNQKTGAKSKGTGARRTLYHRGSPWIGTLRNNKPSVAVRLLDNYRLPIAVMYLGADSVTIKPRFGFRANAMSIGEKQGRAIMDKWMTTALATAKIK